MSEVLSIIGHPDHLLPDARRSLGQRGEELAAEYLKRNRYRLILANFKVPVGRNSRGAQVTGEIDIVALDEETLCFVEVKTRRSDEYTPLTSNVDLRKQRQIIRTAKIYRSTFGLWDVPYRYDVVTVLIPKRSEIEIELIKGFWNEAKFRKRKWSGEGWHEFA